MKSSSQSKRSSSKSTKQTTKYSFSLCEHLINFLAYNLVFRFLGDQPNYPSLASFFKTCCLRFTYLTNGSYDQRTLSWYLYKLALPDLILGCLRFIVLVVEIHDPLWPKILADSSYYMGQASFWFIVSCFIWFVTAIFNRFYSDLSNFRPELQYWIKPLIRNLENPRLVKDVTIANTSHLILILLRFNLIAGTLATGSLYIPILIGFPLKWLPVTIFFTLNTCFQGYLTAAYEINFAIIVAYYLFIYGIKFNRLSAYALNIIPKKNHGIDNGHNDDGSGGHSATDSANCMKRSIRFLECMQLQTITRTREMFKVNKFLGRIMSVIFAATFLAETLCLYLMLFVELHGSTKFIITFLTIITITYGQVICFISGTYVQHRFDECVNQLHHLIVESKSITIPIALRVKVLVTIEYLAGRKLFNLLAAIDTSTMNLIKVQVEMVMILLMLITNTTRLR